MSVSPVSPAASLPGGPATPRPRPGYRRLIAITGIALIAGLVTTALLARPADGKTAPPAARDVPLLDGDLIRFSPAFAQRAGITIVAAEPHEVSPVVAVPGTVELDPRRVAAVGARVPGRVRKVLHLEGDEVRAGDVLAEIESAELGRTQAEVLKLRAREEAALADQRREEALADERISSLRDAQAARAAAVAVRAERLAAEQAVRALGGDDRSAGEIGILRLRTPIAGRVLASNVTLGKSLDTHDTPFQVADLSRVWIALSVFEREVGAVRPGDPVEVSAQSHPGRVLKGRVARVGDTIDRDTRSAEVRVEVENTDRLLRPGESATARIRASGGLRQWVTVPLDAVATIDGKPTVFVAHDATRVQIRPVKTGPAGESRVAVTDGLAAGEQVVGTGVFALKSEIFR